MKKLAVFDFDGTLSRSDTNLEFFRFAMRRSARPWAFLPLIIAGLLIGRFNRRGRTWRNMARMYVSKKLFSRIKDDFIGYHIQNRFGWAAEQVARERAAGNFVVLVSAGPDNLIKPLVRDMKFDLVLASVMDGSRPGKVKFACYGKNKVASLSRAIKSYKIVRAYSDSKSDMPVMALADEQVWINPKTGCRR